MQASRNWAPGRGARRLVLAVAIVAGLAAGLVSYTAVVRAAAPPAVEIAAAADATQDNAKGDGAADSSSRDAVSLDGHVIVEKGGQRIRIQGLGRDREYDSFQQFVQDAPWLAGLVVLTVLLVFLIPLLIIVLLIWYKLRKNRLANETMLKLAERGVILPSTAMDAVASGTASSLAAAAAPASAPAYEQARFLRRRAVWSDLRKGVILCAVGLGLSFYSILDNGTPSGAGLIVLFVGLGYCVLWFFEDRTGEPHRDTTGPRPPGGA